MNAEDNAVEGVGAPQLVRCSSLTRFVLVKEVLTEQGMLWYESIASTWYSAEGQRVPSKDARSQARANRPESLSDRDAWIVEHHLGDAIARMREESPEGGDKVPQLHESPAFQELQRLEGFRCGSTPPLSQEPQCASL